MKQEIPQEVLAAFTTYEPGLANHSPGEITVEVVGGGLINYSYKVNCQLKPDFLLQQINKNVFPHPKDVQENYILISNYAEFEFTGLRLPSPKYCGKMTTLFVDSNENYWRAFEFIENKKSITNEKKTRKEKVTAKELEEFIDAFDGFNVANLKEVIPGFHDLSLRYGQFEDAMKGELYERIAKALPIIQELKKREKYKHFYEILIRSDEFPKRVMHHDAKIANVLFNNKTGTVICPVDFDTVMPGYFFSDLGDMIRSMVCSEDENSVNFENINIRREFYDAILSGYLDIMENQLTTSEKKYIHYSGLLAIYMQALRFLTDYLNGDIYYRVNYPEHNFDRAINQVTLLQKLETFLSNHYNFKHE